MMLVGSISLAVAVPKCRMYIQQPFVVAATQGGLTQDVGNHLGIPGPHKYVEEQPNALQKSPKGSRSEFFRVPGLNRFQV